MPAVGEVTIVSKHCDLIVLVTLLRLFRFCVSCAQQLLWRAPALVLPCGHIATANLPLCRLHFIIMMCGLCFGIFLVTARLGRPATVCRRPGWGTRVTPRLHHWSLTSPVTVCRTAASWHFSACRYCDSLTGYTRRDTTWMQLVQATSTPYCLVSGRCRSLTVSLPACLLTSRTWTYAIVNSW